MSSKPTFSQAEKERIRQERIEKDKEERELKRAFELEKIKAALAETESSAAAAEKDKKQRREEEKARRKEEKVKRKQKDKPQPDIPLGCGGPQGTSSFVLRFGKACGVPETAVCVSFRAAKDSAAAPIVPSTTVTASATAPAPADEVTSVTAAPPAATPVAADEVLVSAVLEAGGIIENGAEGIQFTIVIGTNQGTEQVADVSLSRLPYFPDGLTATWLEDKLRSALAPALAIAAVTPSGVASREAARLELISNSKQLSKATHENRIHVENEANQQKKIAERLRKLKSTNASHDGVDLLANAKRDEAIVSGKMRGKHTMK